MNIAMCTSISEDDSSGLFYKYAGENQRQFRLSLAMLAEEIYRKFGNPLAFVAIDDLRKNGEFLSWYQISGVTKDRIEIRKMSESYVPDIVINRVKDNLYEHESMKGAPWKVYNASEIASLGNKSVSMEAFPLLMPKGFHFIAGSDDCLGRLKTLKKVEKWVVKPLRLNGGRGIELVSSENMGKHLSELNEDAVVQEFCESLDIPELNIKGRHDMRIYIIDGEAVLMSVRQPKAGGFLSNTAQGGTIKFFSSSEIPLGARKLVSKVVSYINKLGCYYFISADMLLTEKGWLLIEINDQPGLPAEYQTDNARNLVKKYVKSIELMCNEG